MSRTKSCDVEADSALHIRCPSRLKSELVFDKNAAECVKEDGEMQFFDYSTVVFVNYHRYFERMHKETQFLCTVLSAAKNLKSLIRKAGTRR